MVGGANEVVHLRAKIWSSFQNREENIGSRGGGDMLMIHFSNQQ